MKKRREELFLIEDNAETEGERKKRKRERSEKKQRGSV